MAISIPESGELKHRVQIVSIVDNPSATTTGAVQEETLLATVWAKVEPTGSLYWGTVQVDQRATHRFWFRAYKDKTEAINMTHGVYLEMKNRKYQPTRVTDANGDGVWVVVEAQEVGEVALEGAGEGLINSSFE